MHQTRKNEQPSKCAPPAPHPKTAVCDAKETHQYLDLTLNSQRKESSMSKATENLQAAQQRAMAGRPKVGGFPYLAETLRRAGVRRNLWVLPACQSLYLTEHGTVVTLGTPLASGTVDVPPFNREALITALRIDQAGNSTFPEFLMASWRAGVVRYDVDFSARTVAYCGSEDEEYIEKYPAVEIG